MFWTDVSAEQILMADLSGKNIRVLIDTGIAVAGNCSQCFCLMYIPNVSTVTTW